MLISCTLPSDYRSLVGIKVSSPNDTSYLFTGIPVVDDITGNIGVYLSQFKQLTTNVYGYGALNVGGTVNLYVTYLPKS